MLSKNLLHYSKFEFFYKCMCLWQFLITREDHYIILLAIPRIIRPMKANATHIFWAHSKYVSSNKGLSLLKVISAYNTTLLSNYIGHIFKHVPPLVFVINRQRERNWRGGRVGETSALILERKCPNYIHLWIKFLI